MPSSTDNRELISPCDSGAAESDGVVGYASTHLSNSKTPAASRAAPGMVSTQVITMCKATPQRTADSRCVAPTPMMAVEMTCVVLMGAPRRVAMRITAPAENSAVNPCTGRNFTTFIPMVRMTRHPPTEVPSPMKKAEPTITHKGT